MAWNADKPALGNQIAEDIPDIEENFQYLYDLLTVREIWVPANLFADGAVAGGEYVGVEIGTNNLRYVAWAFNGATEESVTFQIVMPPNWNRGTIKAKFYWTSASGSTAGDTVEWEIRAGAISDNDALDVTAGTSQVISDTLLADAGAKLQVSAATPALTIAGTPALGDLILFEVSRNVGGTDDMTEDAYLIGVLIQITLSNTVSAW